MSRILPNYEVRCWCCPPTQSICTDQTCGCQRYKPEPCVECANTGREPMPFTEVWGKEDES